MLIFDSKERTSGEAGSSSISQFAYLNASARPEAARVRETLEDFITRFPEAYRGALIARLRSELDEVHHSAFFELALHELLLRSGHQIEAIEPAIQGLVREAHQLYPSDNASFAPGLRGGYKGCRTTQPFPSGLARRGPSLLHEEAGLVLEIRAIPVPIDKKPRRGGAVGVQMGAGWTRSPGQELKGAILGKAKRYGDLPAPYVIAVNAFDRHGTEYDAFAALLGQEVIHYNIDTGASRSDRDWDGVWIAPNQRPRRSGVSAVWVFDQLTPWRLRAVQALAILNPWAKRPIDGDAFATDLFEPLEDRFVKKEGAPLGNLLGLAEHWPEQSSAGRSG